jgi:hypothetical protein
LCGDGRAAPEVVMDRQAQPRRSILFFLFFFFFFSRTATTTTAQKSY